jgi:hypothetical protein
MAGKVRTFRLSMLVGCVYGVVSFLLSFTDASYFVIGAIVLGVSDGKRVPRGDGFS